jgi:hypothetical protein
VWISPKTEFVEAELDGVFWFMKTRKNHGMGINAYIMTMIIRAPRQIVGFAVDKSVNSKAIQTIVDSVPEFEKYYTDGGGV